MERKLQHSINKNEQVGRVYAKVSTVGCLHKRHSSAIIKCSDNKCSPKTRASEREKGGERARGKRLDTEKKKLKTFLISFKPN